MTIHTYSNFIDLQVSWSIHSNVVDSSLFSWNSDGVLLARAALTYVVSLGINTRRVYFMMLFISDRRAA